MHEPKRATLHMIGNAHIDPVWLWRWQEGCHEVLASFRSALDRMNEDPEFLFVSSSAAFYAWVEQIQPAMFEEIRQRVCEGRWEIVGGWWIQPDCNIPGGESFARQGLYGQRYFMEKFGVTARVGYNVDSFGHHGMLPQILQQSGLDYYVFLRPSAQEMGLPSRLFWWESNDGSRVLAYRIPSEYSTWGKEVDLHVQRCAAELRAPLDELMCFYGVGNHGGGPTIENLASIRRLNAEPGMPELIFSTPNRFFDAITAKNMRLPTIHEDFQHHASGCYAVHSGVKYWNRRAEWALVTAERWALVATLTTGLAYPKADFARAWQHVLFNQFHDILAGTSIETAYEDARHTYGEAIAIADRAMNAATISLAWNIGIPQAEGSVPIVVFNPHAWESHVNVETEFARFHDSQSITDDEGNPVPVQRVQSEATTNGRSRISFNVVLPALGYRVYHVVPRPAQEMPSPLRATDAALENEVLRVVFNPETGYIASLFDKRHNIEALAAAAAVPVVVKDTSDTWGHNVFSFREEIGRFVATSVRAIASGPAKATVRVTSEYGRSRLVQDFTLHAGADMIEVAATIDWQEQHKVLKIRFPIHMHFHRVTSEVPFGSIERFANGEEEPGQSWVDISGSARDSGELYGVSIINDGKYSYDVNVRDIGMTVLRSPIYAHHDPKVPQPGEEYTYIDQGVQRFRYALFPHAGGWETAGTVRRAAEFNQRPYTLLGTFHPHGKLPQVTSFVETTPATIIMSAFKQAEDGEDMIVRAYESGRVATHAIIQLAHWNRTITADFGPNEIKTFRIPLDPAKDITEVNLIEWEA